MRWIPNWWSQIEEVLKYIVCRMIQNNIRSKVKTFQLQTVTQRNANKPKFLRQERATTLASKFV